MPSRHARPTSETLGFAFAAVGTALFSLKAIVIKLSYAYPIDAIMLQSLRMLLSVPLYLLVALVLLDEPLTAMHLIGATLVLGGILYISRTSSGQSKMGISIKRSVPSATRARPLE